MGIIIFGCLDAFVPELERNLVHFSAVFQRHRRNRMTKDVNSYLVPDARLSFQTTEIVVGFVPRNRLTILVRNNKSTS